MKIGLLGGSFDPPHVAHLAVARAVLNARGLDRVDLLVTGASPHASAKSNHADAAHRLAMARLAVSGEAGLGVEDCEVHRDGRSYTVETLRQLTRQHPANLYTFIIGGDMLADLPNWREPDALLELAEFVPVFRPGFDVSVFDALPPAFQLLRGRLVEMPAMDVSSTVIRAAVAAGESISQWVTPAVEAYIRAHHLYL